jgi:hypothetical protein
VYHTYSTMQLHCPIHCYSPLQPGVFNLLPPLPTANSYNINYILPLLPPQPQLWASSSALSTTSTASSLQPITSSPHTTATLDQNLVSSLSHLSFILAECITIFLDLPPLYSYCLPLPQQLLKPQLTLPPPQSLHLNTACSLLQFYACHLYY